MRKLVVIAALALFSTAADAKVHEIKIGGRVHRIEVPANCKKISCIAVAKEKKSSARSKKEAKEVEPASPAPVAAAAATVAAPVAAVVAAPQTRQANPEPKPEIKTEAQNDDRKSLARLSVPTAGEEPKAVASSSNTVAAIEPKAEPVRTEAASPVGLWLTQKKEGKIRIEPCGAALCGHVDGKPSEKVLIDMKPGQNNRWNGKIHDLRSGGTYMAHISLKGDDSLVVRGCAFGGMFCGGETWTRAQ